MTGEAIREQITAVILAGGRGKRMHGQDKGLLPVKHCTLIEWSIERIHADVGSILISANRNIPAYSKLGFPVVTDTVTGFAGPLAGIHAALQRVETPFLFTMPCDVPLLPAGIPAMLHAELCTHDAELAVIHDGERRQNLLMLMRKNILADLHEYLMDGNNSHRVGHWIEQHKTRIVPYIDNDEAFLNINDISDLRYISNKLD